MTFNADVHCVEFILRKIVKKIDNWKTGGVRNGHNKQEKTKKIKKKIKNKKFCIQIVTLKRNKNKNTTKIYEFT